MLELSLQEVGDHGMEPRIAGHVAAKLEEVHPTCVRWKEEAVARCEKEEQSREKEARLAEEERRVAPSVLLKQTGLLGGATASGKAKGHPLVHAPNARMSVTQRKVRSRVDVSSLRTDELVYSALSPVRSKRRRRHRIGGRATYARRIRLRPTRGEVRTMREEQPVVRRRTWANVWRVREGQDVPL